MLPTLTVGEPVDRDKARVRLAGLEPVGHETNPPARYTEASLIKELERIGVGRPSTFAATIGTIERRGYVFRQGKALVPSFTAFAVTRLLREHFGDLIDVEFTAEMEEDLDQISRGEREWLDFIKQFYRGDKHHRGLEEAVKQAQENADYPLIDVGVDPESGEPVRVRIGRYGPFLQLGEGGPGKTAGLPPTQAPADLTVEKAMTLVRAKAEGPAHARRRSEERHERLRDQRPLRRLRAARRDAGEGQQGEAEALVADRQHDRIDGHARGGAEAARAAARSRRRIRTSGEVIVAGLGRFGPYIKHGDDYRSLEATDDLFTVDLERALALLAAPKRSARQAAKRVIRKIEVPDGGNAAAGARGALRSVRHRRRDQRVDSARRGSGDDLARGGAGAARSAPRRAAAREASRPARRGRRRAARPRTARRQDPAERGGGRSPPRPRKAKAKAQDQAETEGRGRKARGPQARELMTIRIVGGGLAGSEAAWQAASRGVPVTLYEMRPVRATAVHKTDRLAELVCSNSFRGDKLDNAVGLLKEEMRRLDSLVMRAAEASRVPAGAALAVDRERFAEIVTQTLSTHPLITIVREEVTAIPASSETEPVIVATGPLTSDALSADLASVVGQAHLYFYDAISPIVLAETIDRSKVFRQSRWDRSLRGHGPARRRTLREAAVPRRVATAIPVVSGFSRTRCLRRRRWRGRLPELPADARRVRGLL